MLNELGRRGRLGALRDRHAGQRCVIVANGPSLNRMDLRPLRHEQVIGLNKIYLGLPGFGFSPRYHVAVNPKVVAQAWAPLAALPCVKFVGSRAAREAGVQDGPLTHIVDTERPPGRFSTDLRLGLHEGWTVTFAALQVAWHLGFAEVVLVGLDHRYQYDGAPNEARVMQGADPNHFSGDYFGHGQSWDNPDLGRSEESYRVAQAQFEADGRRIWDATLDGACPVFPKTTLERALGRA
ncbi:6-hydroxymethylpterin diphosphokinase MptE-like protein [Ideonella livida]|uniref:DUF115 domain-containing protein n=1 Tax=Ideonella livida TaxID=2707176 RepID=A0A7C9PKE6_9BURK|nr:6-hydroxymethylpterin diphosphokinase MptE-like protein [Ideonella livida]NDY93411.1 DUF115 domain-containing protein [Ideonella livida]